MARRRQIAVIMFTDIVGYTALMGEDEEKALSILKQNKSIHKRLLRSFRGKFLKEMGDGILCSFKTITDAIYCAGQLKNKSDTIDGLKLRIGIHWGEIVVEGKEIYGDGVNVASRVEGLAKPGQILVSEAIYNNIRNKSGISCSYEGEHGLKNVEEPFRVYSVKIAPGNGQRSTLPISKYIPWVIAAIMIVATIFFFDIPGPAQSNRDFSVAVLPFMNVSGDPEMEAFCDGMTDAVILRLSQIDNIDRIPSFTSMMAYKDSRKSMPEIATELGVNYILEASFQKSDDDIQIMLQLIDGPNDDHFWSQPYRGKWGDIFGIQAEVSELIAKELGTEISEDEITEINKAPTDNVEAYEYFLRGKRIHDRYYLSSDEGEGEFHRSEELFGKAIQIDSTFAEAYAGLACMYHDYMQKSQFNDSLDAIYSALSRKAFQLDPNSSYVNRIAGIWHQAFYRRNYDSTYYHYKRAMQLEPTDARNYFIAGSFYQMVGIYDIALDLLRTGLDLDPVDKDIHFWLAISNAELGNLQQWGEAAQAFTDLSGDEDNGTYLSYLIMLSRFEEAEKILKRREIEGKSTFEYVALLHAMRNDQKEALALLDGLPEYIRWKVLSILQLRDELYEFLVESRRNGSNYYMIMESNYLFDPFRNDPEFVELKSEAKKLHDDYTRRFPVFGLSGRSEIAH